jgi:competence protein ComEA
MSSEGGAHEPPIAAGVRSARHAPVLPWSWPEGARVLLAVLAIVAATGLALGRRGLTRGTEPVVLTAELKLDPNTATPQALAALPHIGPTLARRIAEAQADGPFRSPQDLRARVRGIGPVTLAQIEPYLRFDAGPQVEPRPLDSQAIAIVDAGGKPGVSSVPTSRKPPRSRSRRAKGAPVQLAAKAGTVPPP